MIKKILIGIVTAGMILITIPTVNAEDEITLNEVTDQIIDISDKYNSAGITSGQLLNLITLTQTDDELLDTLSLDKNNGYVILHINRIRVKCWSYSRILANFHDKNQHYNLSVVKLEEMILNGDIKVKFNVSTIKDHGTQWCIAK